MQDLEEAWVQFSSLQLYSWASTELDTDAAKMPGDLLKTIEWDSALDIKSRLGGGALAMRGVLWLLTGQSSVKLERRKLGFWDA